MATKKRRSSTIKRALVGFSAGEVKALFLKEIASRRDQERNSAGCARTSVGAGQNWYAVDVLEELYEQIEGIEVGGLDGRSEK